MSEARFNVIFAGQIVAGADPTKVRENLAAAFRMDMAKVEGLFTGKRVVVKKDADQATAMKFRAVMKQAGAQAELERVGEPTEPAAAPAAAPSPAPASAAPAPATPSPAEPAVQAGQPAAVSGGSLETVGTIRTGGTGFSGPFAVAPTGSDLAVERHLPPPVVPDVSHLSVAPAGADMGEKREEKPPVTPDISHLKIDPL
ncbi:hypothetical protein [Alcanivorax sp. 1008]|uniref:hypothetical protein n=1 Tax=Alcanivorax sp. 1008 TaxID=2816853 RepID=UPI001E039ECF|nr:hypothetical protein [Alcanivorax sp. 1008]MCC1497914.1 hypothetical protein [Alcanivorax sp. 1008]